MKPSLSSHYRTHPVHQFPWLPLKTGHAELAQTLSHALNQLAGPKILVLEGFVGLSWHDFLSNLRAELESETQEIAWFSTESCLRPACEIQMFLESSLTTDPVFGRLFHGDLQCRSRTARSL